LREGIKKRKIKRLVKKLEDKDMEVRKNAILTLSNDAMNGTSITVPITVLAKALGDENEEVRDTATGVLMIVAKGADITVAIPALIDALGDRNENVKVKSVLALENAAQNGNDITLAIPALMKGLEDENSDFRNLAASTLGYATKNKNSRKIALNALMTKLRGLESIAAYGWGIAIKNEESRDDALDLLAKALGDKNKDIHLGAISIFLNSAEHEVDMTVAFPAFISLLGNQFKFTRKCASDVLLRISEKNHKTRVAITKAFMDFMNSHEFMVEAEKNSDRFIHTINAIDELARKIDSLERKAA
jgi:HEAT repeat protein